jgi:nitrogen fixation/metabolism regulation signal transduction histidine kinase
LAHEIKNPLTPIQLSAERLRRKYLATMDPQDADVLDRSTHTIVQQVESLKEMVKAFSEYARMPQLNVDTVNLNHLVEEVLDLYRLERSDARLSADLDPQAPLLQADAGRLRQLLHNLIKNGIEATEHVPDARINVSTRCMKEEACRFVELEVRDSGGGISDELLANLFEPYVTSKRKGTGLGLAIVKKIVEEHGGMVRAENVPGGAAVTIRLPVREARAEQIRESATPRHINRNNDDAAA